MQEDEAQHTFGSYRPGKKKTRRCLGLEGEKDSAGGLSLASSALRAGELNGISQGNNDKNPVVVTFPNRNTFELFGIFRKVSGDCCVDSELATCETCIFMRQEHADSHSLIQEATCLKKLALWRFLLYLSDSV